LRDGLGEFLTELRPAEAVFLRFEGIDYDADDAGLQLRMSLDAGNGGTMMTLASVVDNESNDGYVLMGSMMDDDAGMMGH
jgi:hypothetical protein